MFIFTSPCFCSANSEASVNGWHVAYLRVVSKRRSGFMNATNTCTYQVLGTELPQSQIKVQTYKKGIEI